MLSDIINVVKKVKVYFYPIDGKNPNKVAIAAKNLLERLVKEEKIKLEKEIPLKIHPGQPGNISFIKPENYKEIINYLKENEIKTYFIETGMVSGPRGKATTHKQIAKEHGFTQVPFVIADGENGKSHTEVTIKNGKHFKSCMIAEKLAGKKQIIVLNHFKGHGMAGFGGAIKMLGIGFASRQGKMHVHSNIYTPKQKTIVWSDSEKLYYGKVFLERMSEYALAAVKNKNNIYLTFALSIVENCDCDGIPMRPIYKDLGIFASVDPVAIDKACLDLLNKREDKKAFDGDEVFVYAEKIGLGSQKYELIEIEA
ncbi:MAG: DUF362 domain-containing protein [Actinobacteria bacterium]|nr:DUF362 domain-containing protein [Actinomycetota bacterium]